MKEKICVWLAWLLPRCLAYWCFVRVSSDAYGKRPYATVGSLSINDIQNIWRENQ